MDQNLINYTHELLFELLPLYFEKLGGMFKNADIIDLYCNKNQNRAILMIERHGEITPSQLGRMLDMKKGSLTPLIDSLESMRLVRRKPYSSDRRKVMISLTPEGKDYFQKMITSYQKHLTHILKDQSVEEIKDFTEHLEHVVKFLKNL